MTMTRLDVMDEVSKRVPESFSTVSKANMTTNSEDYPRALEVVLFSAYCVGLNEAMRILSSKEGK